MTGPGRVVLDGKFFRLGGRKFHLKGVTYGPFAPHPQHGFFAGPEQTERDFQLARRLGANLLRVYHVPPRWLLDLADRHGLKLFVDIPWPKHLCFLDSAAARQEARQAVREAVRTCDRHPAVFAFSVVNEIPAEIVRWSGVRRVEAFIDELVQEAKSADPQCLCAFTSFPPTEYLNPRSPDFVCFNVFLHEHRPFERYLSRLQMLADNRPLVLAEVGMDSLREGEARKCDFLSWQIELGFRGGLAGMVLFSLTDDWFRGGRQIEDWAFGLTTCDRQLKDSFFAVQKAFATAPYFVLPRYPRVSVVVASYNGGRTLGACLESLQRLNYPDYEVILVDDGSTDNTPEIARTFPGVRTIRQENHGLSVARNVGSAAATGEIVAYTDSDCRADEDWLYYLVGDLLRNGCAGVGGHNFLPPEDSLVATAVMVSPGGPAHVMLNDREAEHIPGCNMAFYKWSLEEIGGFDPVFRKAGDDVDVCWRLQQHGHRIAFSPAGFVWHYRRSTVKAYLQQQKGYGEAEALLSLKHPEYFNSIGRSIWRGRIYAPSGTGVVLERSIIYHGLFGSGLFQRLYRPDPSSALMLFTSLEYHVLVFLPLLVLWTLVPATWPLPVLSLLLSAGVCAAAAAQAKLPPEKTRFWSRPLIGLLFLLQPVERGFARYKSRLVVSPRPRADRLPSHPQPALWRQKRQDTHTYWSDGQVDRFAFLQALKVRLEQEAWLVKTDSGWNDFDLEIAGHRWTQLHLVTVSEQLDQGRLSFHCRLRSGWSLMSKALFGFLFAVELCVIAWLGPVQPWIWMLLLSMPVASWLLEHEQAQLIQSIAALVDQTAAELKLIKLPKPETLEVSGPKPPAGAAGLDSGPPSARE